MSRGLNRVMVIGNLGGDPELRYTLEGKPVANLSIAVNERFGEKEHTEWFSVVAWGKLGEICAHYLKKGSQLYVEGRLQTRSWEDKDGQRQYRTELVAQEMVMLGGPSAERQSAPGLAGDQEANQDGIPF